MKLRIKMQFFAVLVLVGLYLPVPTNSQVEHAPTVEQCRADVRLWKSQTRIDMDKLAWDEIQSRSLETWSCSSIDIGTGETYQEFSRDLDNYRTMWTAYSVISAQRMQHFIQRHELGKKFLDEDKEGLR